MKIIASEDRFALANATDKDLLVAKEKCGFRFDPVTAMFTGNAANVDMLKNHKLLLRAPLTITEAAAAMYRAAGKKILTAVEMSHAKESDAVIPCPSGLAYLPFQKAGIWYAAQRPDTLNGDDPGLGKTVQAIGLVNCLSEARCILVICPAFLKPMWKSKFQEWDVKGLSVGIAEGVKNPTLPETDVVIINYDILKAYRSALRTIDWDVIIGDEIHKLKNGRADRTREVFGGIKRAKDKTIIERVTPIPTKRRMFLSGTPSLNGKPKELWNLAKELDPYGLGSDWYTYASRYCQLRAIERFNLQTQKKERIGWWWDGAANLDELQERMRSKFMVRRLKSDVMKELPEKRRMIIPFAVANKKAKRVLEKEWAEFKEYKGTDDTLFETPSFGSMSAIRLEIGLLMVEPTIEVVTADLEENDKIVVMCWHKEVARKIAEAFSRQVLLVDGDVAPAKRYELTQTFQTDPKFRVLVGTTSSCSEGLEMFAAHLTIFPERPWEVGSCMQAEDRTHRRGQHAQCLYKHLVLEGSLSEHQVKLLIAKQDRADKMLDKMSKELR
jgi:SWI/SNF-related matrix-associated actin-dependent regulator 1 of chromatin subfamily A